MYERKQEEGRSRNHSVHHHGTRSFARIISAAVMLLTTPVVADL